MSKHQTNCDYFSAHTKNAWKIRIERKLRKNQQTCAEFSAKTNFWIEQWTSSLFPCLKLKPVVYFASFQNSCWDFSENFWIIKATQIILNSALKQLVAREIRKLVLNYSIVSFNLNCYLSQGHHLVTQLKSVEFLLGQWCSEVSLVIIVDFRNERMKIEYSYWFYLVVYRFQGRFLRKVPIGLLFNCK